MPSAGIFQILLDFRELLPHLTTIHRFFGSGAGDELRLARSRDDDH